MNKKRFIFVAQALVLMALVLFAPLACAADWPMFRHDVAHSGASDEIVEPDLELMWKYTIGPVQSSPSVSGGIVYVGSNDNNVYALDAVTGTLIWKYTTGDYVISSPAVFGNIVYVGSLDGYMYALDAINGNLKWKYKSGASIFSSPSISDGIVYFGSEDKNIYALDAATGTLKWKYSTGDIITSSSPAISGGIVYFGSYDKNIYALDAATGTLKWKYTTGNGVESSPAVSAGTVYVGSDDGYVYALDTITGNLKWKYMTGSGIFSSPAISGGTVYIGSNDMNVYALDATTGTLKWKHTTGSGVYYSPAVSGSVIYIGASDYPGGLDALDTATGALRWKNTNLGSVSYSLAVSGGMVYVAGDNNIYAFAPTPTSTYTKTQALKTPSATTLPPALAQTPQPPIPEMLDMTNWVLVGSVFIAIFLIGAIVLRRHRIKKNDVKAIEKPKSVAAPSEDPGSKSQAVLIEKPKELPVKKPKEAGAISVKSAYEYKGAKIYYKIKIENNAIEPVGDIKIHLFVPEVFLLAEKEKAISMLETKESKTVTFEIRPTGECGECNVSGKIEYYDYAAKGRKMLDIENKSLSVICPVLKRKEIDMQQWEKVTDELIKAEEKIKELSAPAEDLFNITSRVIKDNGMFMLKPEITSTPSLFNGLAMFYAEGVTGYRYAAYMEVVGGSRKSRMILKVWAEKDEALIGFYHRILDDIEKRIDIKIFIDDTIVQQHIHIGDKIGTQVKDSVIQRSTIGTDAKKCPDCGREVEANEKFCLECGAKLGG